MATPTTTPTRSTTTAPANGNKPEAAADAPKKVKVRTSPEKRSIRTTPEQYLRIACGVPRTLGELVDMFNENDAGTIAKALKALEAQGVMVKQDGKWLRKPA